MVASPGRAKFAFTKLVVEDLVKEAAFYCHVCGYREGELISADVTGRPIEELLLRTADGALEMVLLSYLDGMTSSPTGSVITAFDTPDLDAYQERLLGAGGTIVQPIGWVEVGANRMRIGFFADPEGHLLEVMER